MKLNAIAFGSVETNLWIPEGHYIPEYLQPFLYIEIVSLSTTEIMPTKKHKNKHIKKKTNTES